MPKTSHRPPTRVEIERELRKSAEHAIFIQAAQGRANSNVIEVTVTKDDGTEVKTTTRSEPWKLGHGQYVIMLDGFSGGFDCARVSTKK